MVGTPVFLFGHSSGGTAALEALVASQSSFAGAMIYEPALVINSVGGLHLLGERIERDGEVDGGLRRAAGARLRKAGAQQSESSCRSRLVGQAF